MDKRTSPRAIYDAAVRWIANEHPFDDIGHVDIARLTATKLVAGVFDVDPMAVARHVLRVRDGDAPPMFHMPTSELQRRVRIRRQQDESEALKKLTEAGVTVGSRWWSQGRQVCVVTGIGPRAVHVHCPQYEWRSTYNVDYFLGSFTPIPEFKGAEVEP